METLRPGTPLATWPSNRFIWIYSTLDPTWCIASWNFPHLEMLTPIDQPLDKLEDLHPDEMYVYPSNVYICSDAYSPAKQE